MLHYSVIAFSWLETKARVSGGGIRMNYFSINLCNFKVRNLFETNIIKKIMKSIIIFCVRLINLNIDIITLKLYIVRVKREHFYIYTL